MRLPLDSGLGGEAVDIASVELVDHRAVDWPRVHRTAYLVHQRIRYDYTGPVRDLRQRLVVIPPERHGDQRRVLHRLEVAGVPRHRVAERSDAFGNHIARVTVPAVRDHVIFETWCVVERTGERRHTVDRTVLHDRRWHARTRLTAPDPSLRALAASVEQPRCGSPRQLAEAVSAAVHRALRFETDVTHVGTTAAQALALGAGVCQDFAHVMISVCRLLGLPARYVSGQLLGEGASHAWVEVLAPDGDNVAVLALDPTHDRHAGPGHITVAVGRDYGDVSPTSGTYVASQGGALTCSKRVGVVDVEYAKAS